jgi:hypothetical protein
MLALLAAHDEVIIMKRHEFNQFPHRAMIQQKLKKGQFSKLKNSKRFVNELYTDTIKNSGLASVGVKGVEFFLNLED